MACGAVKLLPGLEALRWDSRIFTRNKAGVQAVRCLLVRAYGYGPLRYAFTLSYYIFSSRVCVLRVKMYQEFGPLFWFWK